MSTNIRSLDKENEVGPTTPKTLMKKQIFSNNNNGGNGKPNRSQARRVKRLPLASKDSNRSNDGMSFNKNDTKGLSRNSSIHLKKYGSILYQNNNHNNNSTLNGATRNALPKVKSLVLKDIDDNDNNNSNSSDSDEDNILQSIKQGLSQSNNGLSALLEENETKLNDNLDLDIEYAPLRESEIEYIPDGIDVLQIDDLKKLNDIDIEPMTFDLGLDSDNDKLPNGTGSLLMDLQPVTDYNDENGFGMSSVQQSRRDTHHSHDRNSKIDIQIDTDDIDSIYDGHGLDANDIAELLAD